MFNIEELQRFQVKVVDQPNGFMTIEDCLDEKFNEILNIFKHSTRTPNQAVATSIFIRRYGLFITSMLLLRTHNKMWDGPLNQIHLVQSADTISFQIDAQFIRDTQKEDLGKILKNYARIVVEAFATKGNTSKIVLWENIWGYVLWMYGQTTTEQAKLDLNTLLEDHVWQPEIRTSLFRKFLGNRTIEEASNEYQRVTCCLYKELPNMDECPYCPLKIKSCK